jgi:hypothetical protein
MATIMPITTNTTMAICIQIQVGDMTVDSVPAARRRGGCSPRDGRGAYGRLLAGVSQAAQGRFRASMLPAWLDASGGRQDALAERSRYSLLL